MRKRHKGDTQREDGTVLLSTLLVLTLMSAVALALLATLRQSVDRTRTLEAAAQADLYLAGARDFARAQMDQFAGIEDATFNAQLANAEPIILPFENGAMALRVTDGTHCLRLSALADAAGLASETERQRFQVLMGQVGVDPFTAQSVAAAAVDWVDADEQRIPAGAEDGTYLSRQDQTNPYIVPHRTANTAMASVTELRALNGMTEALFQTLLPYVCIGDVGVPSVFNIDSAEPRHLPVLIALLGGGDQAEFVATSLLESRPVGGYGRPEALPEAVLEASRSEEGRAIDLGSTLVFGPERLAVEVTVRYADVERMQLLVFEGLDSERPRLSYQAQGMDEFPSLAWARLQALQEGAIEGNGSENGTGNP